MFDVDGDNAISTSELGRVLQAFGQSPSEAELQLMINEIDADGNGTLSFDEFLKIMSPNFAHKTSTETEIYEAFKIFDKDGNGFVSLDELKNILTSLGEKLTDEEINEMFKDADTDCKFVKFKF